MSHGAMSWAKQQLPGIADKQQRMVLLSMAELAGLDWIYRMPVRRCSERSGVALPAWWRAVDALQRAKLLTVVERGDDRAGDAEVVGIRVGPERAAGK